MTDNVTANASGSPPKQSVALGLFVVFQLGFLFVQNIFSLIQEAREHLPVQHHRAVEQTAPGFLEKKGHLWNFMEGSTQITHRWSQVTLQLQQWSLFAPNVGIQCVFPALLFSDEEPSVVPIVGEESGTNYHPLGKLVLSDNEPVDLNSYFRWGHYRLRKYENNLVAYLTPRDEETPRALAERWRDRIKEHVNENSDMLLAYMKWRVGRLGETSRQVILVMRRHQITEPESDAGFLRGPFSVPVARWLPQQEGAALEYFNPVTHRFEPLSP